MWFKNLQIYRLPKAWDKTAETLEESFSTQSLAPCSSIEPLSIGWVPPCPSTDSFVHSLNAQFLLALGLEEKLLPTTVIRRYALDRATAIFESEGRAVGKKEMRDIQEAVRQELLPRAFINRKTTYGWIDPVHGWLVVDAASAAKAEQFLEHLRKSVGNLPVKLVKTIESPSASMTSWMSELEAPPPFTLDQDLELRSAENAKVRYVNHSLEGEEIREHISQGKVVTRLALTWGEKISFVLNENLEIKRLSFLDILKEESQAENEEERFDSDFSLMSGELPKLFESLLDALGGEVL